MLPFNETSQQVMTAAAEAARDMNHPSITSGHIFLRLIEIGSSALDEYEILPSHARECLSVFIKKVHFWNLPSPQEDPSFKAVRSGADREAFSAGKSKVSINDILIALTTEEKGVAAQLFAKFHLSPTEIQENIDQLYNHLDDPERIPDLSNWKDVTDECESFLPPSTSFEPTETSFTAYEDWSPDLGEEEIANDDEGGLLDH